MFEPIWFGNLIVPRWEAILLVGGAIAIAFVVGMATAMLVGMIIKWLVGIFQRLWTEIGS